MLRKIQVEVRNVMSICIQQNKGDNSWFIHNEYIGSPTVCDLI
jgi:hypothetical protein